MAKQLYCRPVCHSINSMVEKENPRPPEIYVTIDRSHRVVRIKLSWMSDMALNSSNNPKMEHRHFSWLDLIIHFRDSEPKLTEI